MCTGLAVPKGHMDKYTHSLHALCHLGETMVKQSARRHWGHPSALVPVNAVSLVSLKPLAVQIANQQSCPSRNSERSTRTAKAIFIFGQSTSWLPGGKSDFKRGKNKQHEYWHKEYMFPHFSNRKYSGKIKTSTFLPREEDQEHWQAFLAGLVLNKKCFQAQVRSSGASIFSL